MDLSIGVVVVGIIGAIEVEIVIDGVDGGFVDCA